MSLVRERANTLTIPVPTATPWRLRRPATPRRATYPLPSKYNTPRISTLSFWEPDIPSPFPASSSFSQGSLTSPSSSPSSCYSQPRNATPPSHTLDLPKLTLPQASSCLPSPTPSPQAINTLDSPRFPHSPISTTSPESPYNPFLTPPLPHFALFPLATPLLPASPLSIFDRAVSPTSNPVLHSRTPTPGTPLEATFLRNAALSAGGEEREGLGSRSMSPRTLPGVLCASTNLDDKVDRRSSRSAPPVRFEGKNPTTGDVGFREMETDIQRYLPVRRAASTEPLSLTPSTLSCTSPPSTSRLLRSWKWLVPRITVKKTKRRSRRGSRSSWGVGSGSRA